MTTNPSTTVKNTNAEPSRTNRATCRNNGERSRKRRKALLVSLLAAAACAATTTAAVPGLPGIAGTVEAATLRFPTGGGWANPVAGTDQFEDWGFGGSYCYLPGLEHLGSDSKGAVAGARVNAIADGTVRQIVSWGSDWGTAIAVEHKTSTGPRILTVYGHVNASVTAGTVVSKGQRIGSLYDLGTNSHLHLGVNPIDAGEDPKTVAVRGSTTCGTSNLGYVDPIPYLQTHKPASSATQTTASYVGKIVRNRDSGAAYLVKADGRRYHIPSGGDYRALVNNGIPAVNLSPAQVTAIPAGSGSAAVKRVDEPTISGPSKWMTRRTNTSNGYGRDYWITQSAAGKSYTTNKAVWRITGEPRGIYRVKVFVPKREAIAKVTYKVYDGSRLVKTITINQRSIHGWKSLGDMKFTSGTIKIVQADNWGPGPYGAHIGWDAVEAVPIR